MYRINEENNKMYSVKVVKILGNDYQRISTTQNSWRTWVNAHYPGTRAGSIYPRVWTGIIIAVDARNTVVLRRRAGVLGTVRVTAAIVASPQTSS